MSKYIAPWHPLLFLLSLYPNAVQWMHIQSEQQIMQTKQVHEPQPPQSRNDAQDLLLLQKYAHKVAHTQMTLEERERERERER